MNPDVLRIVVSNVLERLAADPSANVVGVSQNDNRMYCRCAKCRAVDEEEGGPTGSLLRFVNAVAEARTCFVAGFRGCYGAAQHFAWILNVLIDDVRLIGDVGMGGVDSLMKIDGSGAFVFFSASRYYKSDLRLLRLARSHGARVCLITDSVLSPLVEYADVVLTAEVRQASFFNSTTAMNAIGEYLLTLLTPRRLERYRAHARERDGYTKELLVDPGEASTGVVSRGGKN